MLRAYLDDAGAEDQKVMVLGGLLAGSATWRAIATEWAAVEEREQSGPFHAKSMRTPKGPCASWTKARYVAFLKELADVAARRSPIHVGVGFALDDYRSALSRCDSLRASIASPFDFCMNFVLQQLASAMKRHAPGHRLTIVIDRPRSDLRAAALRCIAAYEGSFWSECFEAVTFQSRDSSPPLRVADFVANDTFKYVRDCTFGTANSAPIFTERAMGKLVSVAKYYDSDSWNALIEMMNSGVRVSQIPTS